jgi:hypothetical protein
MFAPRCLWYRVTNHLTVLCDCPPLFSSAPLATRLLNTFLPSSLRLCFDKDGRPTHDGKCQEKNINNRAWSLLLCVEDYKTSLEFGNFLHK